MTAAEIDEGALEKAFKQTLERFFITLPPQDFDEMFQAFLAALPAPASGGAAWDERDQIVADMVRLAIKAPETSQYREYLMALSKRVADLPAPASGAAEMRERAAKVADEMAERCWSGNGIERATTGYGASTDIAEAIRALPLTEPGSGD
jgi:hypothetical protein